MFKSKTKMISYLELEVEVNSLKKSNENLQHEISTLRKDLSLILEHFKLGVIPRQTEEKPERVVKVNSKEWKTWKDKTINSSFSMQGANFDLFSPQRRSYQRQSTL